MAYNKSQYDQQYARENITRKFIPFNKNNPTDSMILEWLSTKKNITQYVKELILDDMEKQSDW